jgi:sialic acid synthase SpsE
MTFIIADAGPNWRNLEEAKAIVRKCAYAGVDAVKFQAYKKGHPVPGHPRAAEIDAIVMTPDMARELHEECKRAGIEFLCTAMYPEAVAWLAPMVSRFKIRYADRYNMEIRNQIYKYKMDKLVITSDDNAAGPKVQGFKTLYCVPEYPPKALPQAEWAMYDGFSSHYPDWHVPATEARHWNLEYLEVHVMLDEYDGGWDPIDSAVSLSITDLKKLVKEVKG